MPLYEFACDGCGAETEVFKPLSEYDQDLPVCCASIMRRVYRPQNVIRDIKPYMSTIDGSLISSRSQHRQHLKQNNCHEVGNDYQHMLAPKKPLKGDFNVREELTKATTEVLQKRNR